MKPATNRVVLTPLFLSVLCAGACHHGGSGPTSTTEPPPPLVGTWYVETDNHQLLEGLGAPIGLDNAVMQSIPIWSDPDGPGAAYDLRCSGVAIEVPEFALGITVLEVAGELQSGLGGIYYLPQQDVTVAFETTSGTFGVTRIDAFAEASAYVGRRIVERHDPISGDSYWDIANDSLLIGRMAFHLTMRR